MKVITFIVLLSMAVFASVIQKGDNLQGYSWIDQFEKKIEVQQDTQKLLVVFSKEKGNQMKQFFEANKEYLEKEKGVYIADVSGAPSFVTSMFMIPKFQKYHFSMSLLQDEDVASKYPKKEDMITIIHLENFVVKEIEYKKELP